MSTTVALSNPLHTAIVPQWGQREMETEKREGVERDGRGQENIGGKERKCDKKNVFIGIFDVFERLHGRLQNHAH